MDIGNRNRRKVLAARDDGPDRSEEDHNNLNLSNHSVHSQGYNEPTAAAGEKMKAQRRGSDSEIRAMAIDMLESMGHASIRDLGRKKPVVVAASKRNLPSEKQSSTGSQRPISPAPIGSKTGSTPAPTPRTPRGSMDKDLTSQGGVGRTSTPSPTISQRPVPTMGTIGRARSGTFNTSGVNVSGVSVGKSSATNAMSNKSSHGVTPRDSSNRASGGGTRSRQPSTVTNGNGNLSRQNSSVLVRQNSNVTAATSDRPMSSPLSRQGSMLPLSRQGSMLPLSRQGSMVMSNKSNVPDYSASKAEAEALAKQCGVFEEGRTIQQIKTFRPFGLRFKAGMTLISQHVVLGARDDASNGDKLYDLGITHILNTAKQLPHYHENSKKYKFVYMKIPLMDDESENITTVMDQAKAFIQRVEEIKGRVLVHCIAGASRSVTIVMMYFMMVHRVPLRQIYSYIKAIRPQIAVNDGFKLQLAMLEIAEWGHTTVGGSTAGRDWNFYKWRSVKHLYKAAPEPPTNPADCCLQM